MNWYLIFYLTGVLDKASSLILLLLMVVGIIGTFAIIFLPIFFNEIINNNEIDIGKYCKKAFWFFLFLGILHVLIPSKESMLLIIGGGAVFEFIENDEDIKEIPSEVTEFLKEHLQELNKEDSKQ